MFARAAAECLLFATECLMFATERLLFAAPGGRAPLSRDVVDYLPAFDEPGAFDSWFPFLSQRQKAKPTSK